MWGTTFSLNSITAPISYLFITAWRHISWSNSPELEKVRFSLLNSSNLIFAKWWVNVSFLQEIYSFRTGKWPYNLYHTIIIQKPFFPTTLAVVIKKYIIRNPVSCSSALEVIRWHKALRSRKLYSLVFTDRVTQSVQGNTKSNFLYGPSLRGKTLYFPSTDQVTLFINSLIYGIIFQRL